MDIEMLKRTEARVGSTADSLVRNYMLDVIGFRNANIIEIDPQHNLDDFKRKRLSAVFLELPFADSEGSALENKNLTDIVFFCVGHYS
ncbi:hypothetical protein ACFX2J_004898 [Malus domestica]